MKQGTTFVLIVDIQIDMSHIESIIFTFKNKGNILTKEDWIFDNGKFRIPFTQEETVLLEGRTLIEAQINFKDGNVAKSDIKEIYIKETLATRIIDKNIATQEGKEIELDVEESVIFTSEDYESLLNKPSINGVVLLGDVSLDALNIASKEYVEEEIAKFDFIKIVSELPEVGLPNRIYFVPKTNTSDNDLFDEYGWVNDNWEFYGTKKIEVDLSNCVTFDDIMSQSNFGVAKSYTNGGIGVDVKGRLKVLGASETNVKERDSSISKPLMPKDVDLIVQEGLANSQIEWTEEQKTLARALLEVIGSNDYATKGGTHGLVKIDESFGIGLPNGSSNPIAVNTATKEQVDGKASVYRPITPNILDYAVKKALSDCKLTGEDVWTDEEKAKALELLGGVVKTTVANQIYGSTTNYTLSITPLEYGIPRYTDKATLTTSTPIADNDSANKKYVDNLVGDIEASLDSIIAIQEALIGGEIA